MKQSLKILFPIFLFLGLANLVYRWSKPHIKKVVLEQAQKIISSQTQLQLQIDDFSLNFLSPGISLSGVQLSSMGSQLDFAANPPSSSTSPKLKTDLRTSPASLHLELEEVVASLDFLQLIAGQVEISQIVLHSPRLKFDLSSKIDSSGSNPPPINPSQIFALIRRIPIAKVFIFDLQTQVLLPDQQRLELVKGELSLGLFRDRISSRIKLPSVEWAQRERRIQGVLEIEVVANESIFKIENLQVSHRNSKLDLSANFPEWNWSRGDIGLNAKLQLADLESFAIPQSLKGEVELRLGFDFQDYWPTQGSGLLRGSGLEVEGYSIGGLLASLQVDKGSLKIPRLDIQHSAGEANLENAELNISLRPLSLQIKSQVRTPALDIYKLFESLHIPADVNLLASAQFFCSGPLLPALELMCDGEASARNLRIQTNGKPLLELDPFRVKGHTLISARDIRYQGEAFFGGGRGQSQGVIDYRNGFSIDFNTSEMLDFSAVRKLAELRLEGKAHLRGHTEGDSRKASFWIDLQGQDLFFENYALGQTNGKIKYQAGILEFEDLEGRLGKSFYQGQFSIDLLQERIRAEAQLKRFEAGDVVRALSRFLPFPLDVTGIGNAEVTLSGPLIPSQLSYRTVINLERGSIFGESFERLELRATSDQGRLRADSVKMRKRNSLVSLQGQAFPSGELDFFVRGEALALEDSENISRLKANISGILDFGLNITGTLSQPEFSVKANLTDLILEDQEFEDSNLAMQIDSRSAEGRLFLFGRRLTADFRIPWHMESDFRLTAKALDLDFAPLLSLVGSSRLLSDYSSSLSAQIDLSSKSEGLKNANGGIEINQLVLQRSNLSLSNLSKIRIPFKDGRFDVNQFDLIGPQAEFSLRGKSSRVDALNLELKSQIPLRLVHLLVPGLEEISGEAEIDIKIGGSWLKPEIFGSGKLSRGFFKIPNFPHPLEKIEAKADFSKSFIQIPSIQGAFAGGNLKGEGEIEIKGPRNTPLDLKFKIDGAALNFPEKMKTSGNLELSLSRSWFPFLLSGSYQVSNGWVDKEFTEAEQTQTLKVSSYLPKNLVQDSIDPLEFDLQIQLDRAVKIKNSLADASVTGSLDVLGGPSAPEILGELVFDKGSQILVRDRVFDLSAGRMKFTNPSELNPELFFQGRTRVGDYDVNLLVQGMAKDPQIRLSSSPPLPDKEIISLLALGMTSSTLEKSQQQNATQGSTVDRVGTALLSANPVTKRIQDNLGVELEISSSYDDKKNVSSRRLTMSRRLNEKLRVSASRQQKEQSSTEFKAEYALTPQLSAVAAWENREPNENRSITEDAKTESIFGLDLDFRREFK